MTEPLILHILLDFGLAFVVGFCWGILFGSPKSVLWVAGLLGALGHSLRFVMLQADLGLISATMISSITIGLIGIYCAQKVHHPPVVFTMPAFITMIPGLYAYRTMLGCIKLTDPTILQRNPGIIGEIGYNLMLTMSLLFTLAIGISIAALLFRSKSVREINFGKKPKKEGK
ncbi:threonine/serine exporter family protein [Parabacteroides sp. FAFU027]|uniref:threonine/serine exporter family protein n=1 Tax=Parabacteroides sp. FAFU027 TaxID=2922715 RepID=UPI001FAF0369|nr:threonine/serine exporter family protein [Parabacteroides sp. FAFU027]